MPTPCMRNRHIRNIGLTALVAALVGAGIIPTATAAPAAPAAPSGSVVKVVKACAKKKTGDMRLVSGAKKCRKNERFLKWNVAGPVGSTGPTGATGPSGPAGSDGTPGATGPSHTFWASSGASITDLTSDLIPVVSSSVPAGKYLVQANTYLFQPTGAVPLLAVCRVLANGEPIDASLVGAALFDTVARGATSPVPVTLTFTAARPTTVTYVCGTAIPGNTARSQFATLALTEVGAIN